MRREQGAALIWPVLSYAASQRQTLTYKMLGDLIGSHHRPMRYFLGCVQEYCREQDIPGLQGIVVNDIEGVPGEGFNAEETANVPKLQQRIFKHDWYSEKTPTIEDFQRIMASVH